MAEPQAGSPQWWLAKLEGELNSRQVKMRQRDDYYRGDHPLPFVTKAHNAKLRNEFRSLLEDSRSNFMGLVVDATEERLRVEGFRLSAETDPVADAEAWRIWQANEMDAESQTAFLEALIKGIAYLSVWHEPGAEFPTIAVEDPLQTIVAYEPGSNYRRRAAALKTWKDDWTGRRRANLYLPGGIHKFEARVRETATTAERTDWKEIEDGFVENPHTVVPIIPLRNRPRLLVEGESELENVYRIQNQINGLLFLLALAGYFGAHRQRWASGVKLYEDEDGKLREPFDVAIDRLWATENPEAKFGDFDQTDLEPYIKAIEQKVLHIAVTSRTPRHYLIQQGQSPSGDAIRSAEAGLVKKVLRKHRPFGEGLEEAVRLARRFAGEEDAPVDSEIVWADPETRTVAETTDAVIKQFQAGLIPADTALEQLGYTQTQIRRITASRASDALLAGLGGPSPQPTEDEDEPEPSELP